MIKGSKMFVGPTQSRLCFELRSKPPSKNLTSEMMRYQESRYQESLITKITIKWCEKNFVWIFFPLETTELISDWLYNWYDFWLTRKIKYFVNTWNIFSWQNRLVYWMPGFTGFTRSLRSWKILISNHSFSWTQNFQDIMKTLLFIAELLKANFDIKNIIKNTELNSYFCQTLLRRF